MLLLEKLQAYLTAKEIENYKTIKKNDSFSIENPSRVLSIKWLVVYNTHITFFIKKTYIESLSNYNFEGMSIYESISSAKVVVNGSENSLYDFLVRFEDLLNEIEKSCNIRKTV